MLAALFCLLLSCDEIIVPDPGRSAWSKMESSSTANLRDIWGRSSDDIFAVGDSSTVLHYDGIQWTKLDAYLNTTLYCVGGNDEDYTLVAGDSGTVLHYRGDSLAAIPPRRLPETAPIIDMWTAGYMFMALAGDPAGTIYSYNYDFSTWESIPTGSTERLNRLIGFRHGQAWEYSLIAVGRYGTALSFNPHCCNQEWVSMETGTAEDLVAIFGETPDNLFAVGQAGTILQNTKSFVAEPPTPAWRQFGLLGGNRINDIRARDYNDIFMVGENGRIVNFNRESFTEMASPTSVSLNALWVCGDEVFAVGDNGTILKYSEPHPGPACPVNVVMCITPGLRPIISWSPGCPVSKVIVENREGYLTWFITTDGNLIKPRVEYGITPANAIELRPADGPLAPGELFRVSLFRREKGLDYCVGAWNVIPGDTTPPATRIDLAGADDSRPYLLYPVLRRIMPGMEIYSFASVDRIRFDYPDLIADPVTREDKLNIRPVVIESLYLDPETGQVTLFAYRHLRAADQGDKTIVWDALGSRPKR